MRTVLIIVLASFLAIISFSFTAKAEFPPDLANEIQGLTTELKSIEAAEQALSAEYTSLKNEEQRLIATKELLDGAVKNFKNEADAWKLDLEAQRAEATRQRAEMTSHNAEVEAHNSRCGGGTSSDRNLVNQCNSRAPQLNVRGDQLEEWGRKVDAWKIRVDDRRDTLVMKQDGLKERYTDLQNHVLDWAKRKKENNFKLNELEARKHSIRERLQAIWNSPAIKDLEQREELSRECKRLAESANPDDLNDTRLEQAHHCLQRIFDGAK